MDSAQPASSLDKRQQPISVYGDVLCYAWKEQGSCRFGDVCRFRHAVDDASSPDHVPAPAAAGSDASVAAAIASSSDQVQKTVADTRTNHVDDHKVRTHNVRKQAPYAELKKKKQARRAQDAPFKLARGQHVHTWSEGSWSNVRPRKHYFLVWTYNPDTCILKYGASVYKQVVSMAPDQISISAQQPDLMNEAMQWQYALHRYATAPRCLKIRNLEKAIADCSSTMTEFVVKVFRNVRYTLGCAYAGQEYKGVPYIHGYIRLSLPLVMHVQYVTSVRGEKEAVVRVMEEKKKELEKQQLIADALTTLNQVKDHELLRQVIMDMTVQCAKGPSSQSFNA
jgi:hypothetical protein